MTKKFTKKVTSGGMDDEIEEEESENKFNRFSTVMKDAISTVLQGGRKTQKPPKIKQMVSSFISKKSHLSS